MGNESGVSKLMSSRAQYQGMGNSQAPCSDITTKGFELKPGSNGRSSGASLPIYQGPGDGPSLGMPKSDIGSSDDSGEDMAQIVEPDQGFAKEPVAGGR